MKKIKMIFMAGLLLISLNVFADDVSIDSNGNVKTGVSNSNAELEVTGGSGEGGILGTTSGTGATGVTGTNTTYNNFGVLGSDWYGVYGYSLDGYAGYFMGNTRVTGNLTVNGSVSGPNIGDITGVTAGTGLSGGGSGGSVSLSANTNYLQRRVTGTCAASEAIRVVNDDGSVTCVSMSSGFTLPYSGTASVAGSAFSVTNNGGATDGQAIYGKSLKDNAVYGESSSPDANDAAFFGKNLSTGMGVYGGAWGGGVGVHGYGSGSTGIGVKGVGNGYAGYFEGRAYVRDNFGIGTPTPAYKLDVAGAANLNSGISSGAALWVNGAEALWFNDTYFSWGYGGTANYFADSVGIGTTTPSTKLQISGGTDASLINGSGFFVIGMENNANIVMDNNEIIARANGAATRLYLNTDSGNVVVPVIEITGGSDLSEQFEISAGNMDLRPSPGMVVSIDTDKPGTLTLSNKSYDKKVAGIISGAGGVNPGMLMGQKGTMADGVNPVALTGRVYCWADTTNGLIEPGDLLTTSDIPGHAMKVTDHAKAQGAIIGKAMTSLDKGKGLVLVLVTLQ